MLPEIAALVGIASGAPAAIDQITVTQLMAFVVVRVYTTGRWIGKCLISQTSYEFGDGSQPLDFSPIQ
jgi:hypothetical protein